MNGKLRIAVADDEPDMQDFFERMLPRMGHEVVAVAGSGRQLVAHCRALKPDLVITDIKMPELDGIEAADEIYRFRAVPVILISAFHDEELALRASRKQILAYLVKPIKAPELGPAMAIAMQRFREFETLRDETADLKQALEDRKTIERAKGILMKRTGASEPDAFRRLQKLASSKSRKLVEIARMIITAEEALEPDHP